MKKIIYTYIYIKPPEKFGLILCLKLIACMFRKKELVNKKRVGIYCVCPHTFIEFPHNGANINTDCFNQSVRCHTTELLNHKYCSSPTSYCAWPFCFSRIFVGEIPVCESIRQTQQPLPPPSVSAARPARKSSPQDENHCSIYKLVYYLFFL